MTLTIRTATPQDAADIRTILTELIALGGLTALKLDQIEPYVTSKIEDYVENGSFIVAEADHVVGFQYLHPYPGASAHVGDIATFARRDARQTGIGRALFEQTSQIAAAKGFHKITARIRGDNSNGLPYYARMGFREVGVYRDHTQIDGKLVDQVLMELILT